MEEPQMSSAVSPDEELLTADQAYQYFLPQSPPLVPVQPSFEAEEDDFFANSSFTAERDFYELFTGLIAGLSERTTENSSVSGNSEDHFQLDSQSENYVSEHDNLESDVAADTVQYRPPSPYLPPVSRRPDQHPERSSRPNARRSKLKWDVPILLKGSEVVACPDTGSEQNILSKVIATQIGILDHLDSSRSARFVLGNGRDVQSLGAVDMELCFAQEPEILLKCMFHVFESLIRPAILGGAFLRHTETLTKHRQRRLRQKTVQTSSLLQVMHVGGARERFRCYVDNNLVDVHADTGSEMDLVSKKFVRKSSQRAKALQDPLPVEFADGSIGWISHQIFTRFSPDLERPKSEWTGKWFYVLDDLPCEILLGEETLDNLDAFNRETSFAMETLDADGIELCTIFWASHLERKVAEVFKFNWKGQTAKRKNDADEATNQIPEISLTFDNALLADVNPKFREWLGEMLAGKELPDQSSLPCSINLILLNALDGWETNRRSKINNQNGRAQQWLEERRRLIFDSSREVVLQSLQRAALVPVDEAMTPANSHMVVLTEARIHFCPVDGCRRGPGGRGFKRKNEMIRHGLIHTSPGYVCPFCSDDKHKYPRPDNLQRHVRAHHPDRDRDDPLLQNALTQSLEGNHERRRRLRLS